MNKTKVAFICVHNSCRSQIAEALCRLLASDTLEGYSAGTELKDRINPDAVRLMREIYSVDMEATQKPKLLAELPQVDVAVTMGCNVSCPALSCKERFDWGLSDPTGHKDEVFRAVIAQIEQNVKALAAHCRKAQQVSLYNGGNG